MLEHLVSMLLGASLLLAGLLVAAGRGGWSALIGIICLTVLHLTLIRRRGIF